MAWYWEYGVGGVDTMASDDACGSKTMDTETKVTIVDKRPCSPASIAFCCPNGKRRRRGPVALCYEVPEMRCTESGCLEAPPNTCQEISETDSPKFFRNIDVGQQDLTTQPLGAEMACDDFQ
jgi:hypothetical protein